MQPPLTLPIRILPARLAICQFPAQVDLPSWAQSGSLWAAVRTEDELSIVCEEMYLPADVRAETGWRALKVEAILDFSLIGILAVLSQSLAEAGVSIFVLSTFATDYILVKDTNLAAATHALLAVGCIFVN